MKRKVRVKSLEGTPYKISQDEQLGRGTYGTVYRAYNSENPSQQLVVKIISMLDQTNLPSIQAELEIIRELPYHQNLVNCKKAHIESQNNLYIIMEYCNQGSVEGLIDKMTLMPEEKIWEFLRQVCKGYQVLHDNNLLHRDIKPQNILIHNGMYKLADFGLAKRVVNPMALQKLSFKGTPIYIAPEVAEQVDGSAKVDIFSLGCVVYQLAYAGDHPFYNPNNNYQSPFAYYKEMRGAMLMLKQKNKRGEVRSMELRKLLEQMLQRDQAKRISWQQLFGHKRIDINKVLKEKVHRTQNDAEKELMTLTRSLVEINRSSATMRQFPEKPNIREMAEQGALELMEFEQFLGQKQFRDLEHCMTRLKITNLAILHCTGKILHVIRENDQHQTLHPHILDTIKSIAGEGLMYGMRCCGLVSAKIDKLDAGLMQQLRSILQNDEDKLRHKFSKGPFESTLAKGMMMEEAVEVFDVRKYQDSMYTLLTEFVDYPPNIKQKVKTIFAILIDIYDSSLKLTELIQNGTTLQDVETKMDELCLRQSEPHEFHDYLMSKERIKEEELEEHMKCMGLMFA